MAARWATSKETPTIHRTVDSAGKKRLIMFSGLYPIRMAVSEDDGQTWVGLSVPYHGSFFWVLPLGQEKLLGLRRAGLRGAETAMTTTPQSDVGTLRRVMVKRVADAFHNRESIAVQWHELNYLEAPDLGRAAAEQEQFLPEATASGHRGAVVRIPTAGPRYRHAAQ